MTVVGVPTEIKVDEHRVGLTPSGVRELTGRGHTVLVQAGAGAGSAIPDADFVAQGATIVADADAVFAQADLVVKVKEPQPVEVARLRADQTLFTYLHLAPDAELTQGPDRLGRDDDRLRDGHRRARSPAAAGADERGRGQAGHAGRRVRAAQVLRRARHPARRRRRRGRREGRGHRRRRRRHQRRARRGRHGRRRRHLRPQHRPPARARADALRRRHVLRLHARRRAGASARPT